MKKKKQNIRIRELFRQKLGNAEIIPDASIKSKLMRKVAQREFMRFNPARFNIYYLGGILIAGIIALILSSGSGKSDRSTPLSNSNLTRRTDSTVYLEVPAGQPQIQKQVKLNENFSESTKKNVINKPKIELKKELDQKIETRQYYSVTRTGVRDSIVKKNLLAEKSPEKDKLQGGVITDEILFEESASEGCAPLKVYFYNKTTSYDSCRWTFGDGGYSYEQNPEWIFDIVGEYKVILNVFGSSGKSAYYSTLITVHPKPVAHFEISPEKAVLPDDEIRFINYSADAAKYSWNFGDGSFSEQFEPLHRYSKFGNFNVELVVSSEYGCSDSLIVMNAFSESEYFIDFPNAFIPNQEGPTDGYYSSKSDEAAQVFHPIFSGISDYQLKVFSKLGILLFESTDINIGWDGYFKGQVSNPGVYIWKVRGKFRNGESFIKMGDVTLLKN